MEQEATGMLATIGNVFTEIISWAGEFFTALTSQSGALNGLMELFAIGIGCSIVLFAVRIIRGVAWGA